MDQNDKNNEGVDSNNALKDSGNSVKFEEYQAPHSYSHETTKTTQWIIKHSGGLVKDDKQASYVILGLAFLFVVINILILVNISSAPTKPPAGYRGNIPNLPEYNHPPTPPGFR